MAPLLYSLLLALLVFPTALAETNNAKHAEGGDVVALVEAKSNATQPPPPLPPDNEGVTTPLPTTTTSTNNPLTDHPATTVSSPTPENGDAQFEEDETTTIKDDQQTPSSVKKRSGIGTSTDVVDQKETSTESSTTLEAIQKERVSTRSPPETGVEQKPTMKVTVNASVSSTRKTSGKTSERPMARSAGNGNTILLRSGAHGVCATPYGKMTVGQAIHWIGCRKIVCRSERGFPYLLEQTCPPLPSNLPPGCTILQPSQTLPYPSCCPMPSCPPLMPRLPPRLKPILTRNRSSSFPNEQKNKSEDLMSLSPESIKIEESIGKIEIFNASDNSSKIIPEYEILPEDKSPNVLLELPISRIINNLNTSGTDNLVSNTTTNEEDSHSQSAQGDETSSKSTIEPKSETFGTHVTAKKAKKMLDMLVEKERLEKTTTENTIQEEFQAEISTTTKPEQRNEISELERKRRIDKLLENTTKNKELLKKSRSKKEKHVTTPNEQTFESSEIAEDNKYSSAPDDFLSKFYDTEDFKFNYTDPFDRYEINEPAEEGSENEQSITVIQASYQSNRPDHRFENRSGNSVFTNFSSPVVSEMRMTKISLTNGYSNVEQSEFYNYSDNNTKENPIPSKESTLEAPVFYAAVGTNSSIPNDQSTDSSANRIVGHQLLTENVDRLTKGNSTDALNIETNVSAAATPKFNVVETRPQYLKLFSLLKQASGNETIGTEPYKALSEALIPNNLNKRERLTLSIVSEAIGKGLDALLTKEAEIPAQEDEENIPQSETKTTQAEENISVKIPRLEENIPQQGVNISHQDKIGTIEFIYVGMGRPPLHTNNSDVVFVHDGDSVSAESKQVERTRRNTKLRTRNVNELEKGHAERNKPVFYIPWRNRFNSVTQRSTPGSTITKDEQNITAEASTNVEITTKPTTLVTVELSSKSRSTVLTTTSGSVTTKATPTRRSTTEKVQQEEKVETSSKVTEPAATARRSRSRMTIPGIRPVRARPANATRLNERLSAFSRSAHNKYLQKNKQEESESKMENQGPETTPSTSVDSASSASEKRRFRGRRLKVEASSEDADKVQQEAAGEKNTEKKNAEDKKLDEKKETVESKKASRLESMRQRLLSRRRPSQRRGLTATEKETSDTITKSPDESTATNISASVIESSDILRKEALPAKSSEMLKSNDEQKREITTLPVLTINSEKQSEHQNEIKPTDNPNGSPKKDLPNRSLSSRLRFQNMVNPRKRTKIPIPNYGKSTPPTVLKVLTHEPAKKGQATEVDETVDAPDNTADAGKNDLSLNTIDGAEKVESNSEAAIKRPQPRRPNNLQRERLLNLIRARGRARQAKTQDTPKDVVVGDDVVVEATKKEEATKPVQSLVPQKVELKRIPIEILATEKPILVTPAQTVRRRLNPKLVSVTVITTAKPTVPALSPIRVTNPPELFQRTSKIPIANSISHPPRASPPQQLIRTSVRKPALSSHPPVQQLVKQPVPTHPPPQRSQRPQQVYVPPKGAQIVTQPKVQQHVPQSHSHHSQNLYHPIQPSVAPQQQRLPQPVPPSVYPPINQLVQNHPQTQTYDTRQHGLQPPPPPYQPKQQHQPKNPPPAVHHHHSGHHPPKHNQQSHFAPKKTNKDEDKEDAFESLLPTPDDFPEMRDDFDHFDFGNEEFEYKEPQFVLDYKKQKEKEKSFAAPKESKENKQKIPEGAKVTEQEYFVDGPSGVPIKVTTVTFHTSKSTVRNENVKNRSSHFKTDPFEGK